MLGHDPRRSVRISLYMQYLEFVLTSGIHYQSLWRYRVDSELLIDLLDVPLLMYVVPNCCGFGPTPSTSPSVTRPVLPLTKQYTSLAASISAAQEQVDMWIVLCGAMLTVERVMVPRQSWRR